MPIEFQPCDDEDLDNCLIAMQQAFYCNYLMDKHEFDEALALLNILSHKKGMSGINKYLLDLDRLYIELLNNNLHNAQILYTKELKKFMKSMKKHPAILRSQYVYALLVENDEEKADQIKIKFDNLKNYPYIGELETEKELMAIARKNFLRNNTI